MNDKDKELARTLCEAARSAGLGCSHEERLSGLDCAACVAITAAFAKVREDEREACAQIADGAWTRGVDAEIVAEMIRARSAKPPEQSSVRVGPCTCPPNLRDGHTDECWKLEPIGKNGPYRWPEQSSGKAQEPKECRTCDGVGDYPCPSDDCDGRFACGDCNGTGKERG